MRHTVLRVPLVDMLLSSQLHTSESQYCYNASPPCSVNDGPVDRHPERRAKVAYDAFEKQRLPELKAENPNLRLSQLKQMIRKDWMKSPENPLNQIQAACKI